MNVSTPARKVRRHIVMLASIGAASFAAYLAVVSTIAVRNEQRLENIVQVKQPLIEHLRASEQALSGFKTDLTNAISLEDPYLIEDAEALAREFGTHLRAAEELASQRREDITQLITDFERYRQQALSISRILVDDPGEAYRRQEEMAAFNSGHEALLARMSALINTKIGEYATELGNARQGMEETRLWGVFLGSMTIMLLLGLTVPFGRNAMAAITRSDRMKDEFLSTISHELRTPMNGIMGAINLLRGTDVSPAQQQLLDSASSSSSDMLLAVNDILEFSDFLTGNISQHARDFTLTAIIDDVILKYRQECERKGLALHLRMPDKPWLCHGDADHITHVLRHLLGNAVKFTQTGSVTVTVEVTPGSTFSQLAITVRDTGPGVPTHQIEEIFKPFQQLDGSYTRQYGGLGIGLPICRRIATALNGTLDFANHPEGGIEVRLTAPLEARIQEHPVLSNASGDAPANAMVFAESLHVLVVEDNKVNQMVINGYLKRMGCTAQTANNGQEALEKLARDQFDVILMDCQMPVMDGFEATRAIRGLGDEKRSRLPIIAVTANVMEGDRERCFDSGMDDYLPKPVDMLALKAAIERNLKPQRAA